MFTEYIQFNKRISMPRGLRNLDKMRVSTLTPAECFLFHVLIMTQKSLHPSAIVLSPVYFTRTQLVSQNRTKHAISHIKARLPVQHS